MENCWNKISFKDCKWTSLIATATETPLLDLDPFLELEDFPFLTISPFGELASPFGELASQYKGETK